MTGLRQFVASFPPTAWRQTAKTGGTSLIASLRAASPRGLQCSERGNLALAYTEALVQRGLRPGQFIYGHPAEGAMLPLCRKARIVTILREPHDQVISNDLWIRQDPNVPDHALAQKVGLRDFLLRRPYFAIFQTASLHV